MKPTLIGKGAFTKAYLYKKKVLLKSSDPVKELMALGWFPNSRLFPKVKFTDKEGFDYEMKYYPKTSSLKNQLKPSHWKLYQNLRELPWEYSQDCDYARWKKAFKAIKNKRYRDCLIAALEICAAVGRDINFEISPRNVRVHKGNLILLDCFFLQSQLNKKHYYY